MSKEALKSMQLETIITLATLGVVAISGIVALVVSIVRGDMKKFIVEQMKIAEKSGMTGAKKLEYVLNRVKEKYKIVELVLNVKKFVEYVISISKNINSK